MNKAALRAPGASCSELWRPFLSAAVLICAATSESYGQFASGTLPPPFPNRWPIGWQSNGTPNDAAANVVPAAYQSGGPILPNGAPLPNGASYQPGVAIPFNTDPSSQGWCPPVTAPIQPTYPAAPSTSVPPIGPTLPNSAPGQPSPPIAPVPDQSPPPAAMQGLAPQPAPFSPSMGNMAPESMAAMGSTGAEPGQFGAATPGGGYLDSAVPFTNLRFRFNAAFDDPFPDRGEYLYAKCGCFPDSNAKGPPSPVGHIDYQDYDTYFEYAPNRWGSFFVELPFRTVQFHGSNNGPLSDSNSSGLADMNAGVKQAIIANPNEYFTFQFRTYIPTGRAMDGLGTGHVSLEPGFLYYAAVGNGFTVQGEFKDWIPIGGANDFRSNVLEYGAGLGYALYQSPQWGLQPLLEVVGWTFIGGLKDDDNTLNNPGGTESANGDTIVNIKLGARLSFGGPGIHPANEQSSLYVGYGHCVTGDVLYRDIVRAEYRINF